MGIGNGRIKRVTNIAEHMQYTDTNGNLEDTTNVQDALDSAGTQLSAIVPQHSAGHQRPDTHEVNNRTLLCRKKVRM